MITSSGLKLASLNVLIDEFAASAVRQAEAQEDVEPGNEDDYEAVNREIAWGWEVRDEILLRGQDGVVELITLFSHPDMQVKLCAAKAIMDIEPLEARRMVEWIANEAYPPQSGDAGMCLLYIDRKLPWQKT